jgi:hypothetical protein
MELKLTTMLPHSIHELFATGDTEYRISTDDAMDNVQAMRFFLDYIGAELANMVSCDGTQVTLGCDGYDHQLVVDAGGLGDSFNHKFVISKL